MSPRLSIIVPFYNVERYLGQCLESLQSQVMGDFEAILVDDGSPDGSLDIAKSFCASDPRFRIVRQENQGLGPARNTGVAAAQGEFLAFVDSDDLVPARAYDHMVQSLTESGSDMVSGDARRFNDLGVRESYVHKVPFAKEQIGTHVREFPPLALDRMAWNKVIRRRFWDQHGFVFPAMLYEDYPVTIRLHVLARQVDVLSSPVYYWREREGGELSITQRVWELRNLRDRADSAADVLDFVHEHAPEVAPVVEGHLLHIDVSAIAAALHENDPSEHEEILELADRIYRRTSPEAREAVIPFERVQNALLAAKRVPELKRLVDYRAENGTAARLRLSRRGLRRRARLDLPFIDDLTTGVPPEVYDVDLSAARMQARVRTATWAGGKLELDLSVALRGLRMGADDRVRLWLESEGGRPRRVRLPVERYELTRPVVGRDLSGVRVVVDPQQLGRRGVLSPGSWHLVAKVTCAGVSRTRAIHSVDAGPARWAPGQSLGNGLEARTDQADHGFSIRVRRPVNQVLSAGLDGDQFVLRGTYGGTFDPAPSLRMRVDDNSETHTVRAVARESAEGIHQWEARFPAGLLVTHQHTNPVEERTTWLVRLLPGDRQLPLAVPAGAPLGRATVGVRRISAEASLHGNLLFHDSYAHPLVTAATWIDSRRLMLTGQHTRSAERPSQVVARRYVTPADRIDVSIPLRWEDDRFEAEVDLAELIARADEVRTGSEGRLATPWEFLMVTADGLELCQADTAAPHLMATPRAVGGRRVRASLGRSARMRLVVE